MGLTSVFESLPECYICLSFLLNPLEKAENKTTAKKQKQNSPLELKSLLSVEENVKQMVSVGDETQNHSKNSRLQKASLMVEALCLFTSQPQGVGDRAGH